MNVVSNNNDKCEVALAALFKVNDPEIGLNIVDLGLIYQVNFDEENKTVCCSLTLTSQFCPMGESIVNGVQNALQKSFPEYKIKVKLTFNPPWNHEMISEEGRSFLNK